MLHSNPKILLRICQADAYGVATEYIKSPRDDEVLKQALKFEKYVQHPTHSLKAGHYSDDGQMSIAVAEVLLEGPPYTQEKFADAFVRCFKRDPRDGYSRQFQKFLESIHNTQEFLAGIKGDSAKNGGCMRAVPIGVLKTPEEVLEVARIQASVTHNTNEGIWSAQVIALMSHYALYHNDINLPPDTIDPISMNELGAFLLRHMPRTGLNGFKTSIWTHQLVNGPKWTGPVTGKAEGGVAIATVKACYTAILNNFHLSGTLSQIIEWGGDTDSVAAVAWGIQSSRIDGGDECFTGFWEDALEPGAKYGVDFLKDLGQRLMNKYA